MTHRRNILTCVAIALVMVMASAAFLVMHRGDAERTTGVGTSAAPAVGSQPDCRAMWTKGFELDGIVGDRESQAYFDMAPVFGAPEQVSGIVVFPDERGRRPLADVPIGLSGDPPADGGCAVQLNEAGGRADGGAGDGNWQLRIVSTRLVTGTRTMPDGRTDAIDFDIVRETPCDGSGEWRTFSAPQWPITFDYPANWVLTDDQDDVNIECPSVTGLAAGGSWLTFERGHSPPAGAGGTVESPSSSTEPYWFVRHPDGEWRVNDLACNRAAGPGALSRCAPARRTERKGMTVLQGAAGEHRRYRPGIGHLGEGTGITRYLFVLGDQWVSLDSAGGNRHHDDIGTDGGPVLLDGDAVGERVVRSVTPRFTLRAFVVGGR